MSFISANLNGFSNQLTTTAPNNVIPVSYLAVIGGTANIDGAFQPKGTGALLAAIPDNTAVGGNKRGSYAVDWQLRRITAADVAAGSESAILSGAGNRISAVAAESVIAGGQVNTITGQNSIITGGTNNLVGGANAGSLWGSANEADGAYSAVGGSSALDRGIYGAFCVASGRMVNYGDNQQAVYQQFVRTLTAAAAQMTGDGGAATAANTMILPNNSIRTFRIDVAGLVPAASDYLMQKIEGAIFRGANAAATVLTIAPAVVEWARTAGAAGWAITVAADTVLGGLKITVSTGAVVDARWGATIYCREATP